LPSIYVFACKTLTNITKSHYDMLIKLNILISFPFNVWPFKFRVSAVAGALLNLNACCRPSYLSDRKDVRLTEQYFSICLVQFNI